MPNPTAPQPAKARGAKCRANLMKGGQPGRRKQTAAERAREVEIRRISRRLLLGKKYQANLRARLISGKIQPGVEVALYYYAFGKPPETIETRPPTPIRLVHEYASVPPPEPTA